MAELSLRGHWEVSSIDETLLSSCWLVNILGTNIINNYLPKTIGLHTSASVKGPVL